MVLTTLVPEQDFPEQLVLDMVMDRRLVQEPPEVDILVQEQQAQAMDLRMLVKDLLRTVERLVVDILDQAQQATEFRMVVMEHQLVKELQDLE